MRKLINEQKEVPLKTESQKPIPTYSFFMPLSGSVSQEASINKPTTPLTGPLSVTLEFYLERPEEAPQMTSYAGSGPLLDELAIALIASMDEWWTDRAQIARLQISKFYPNAIQKTGIQVVVSPLENED